MILVETNEWGRAFDSISCSLTKMCSVLRPLSCLCRIHVTRARLALSVSLPQFARTAMTYLGY